ncbi:MAG: NAD(P)H-hydrate dehydratase [Candidatus Lokiarchaeota archaeon]|nr:NAD(P)H-hydrate dehydratase [Candidatus Lokiarchaeota archaeon]MBD3340485.1 NAD(P)H-hydrate dehydratase [Candidatus Lokiarchaeota archaeon]
MKFSNPEKISSKEMGVLDNNAEWLGIPKGYLMECAGYSFATEVYLRYNLSNKKNSHALIFCGTGNNGGDGFVIARHLASLGIESTVVLAGNPQKITTKEAKTSWNIISNHLTNTIRINIAKDSTDIVDLGIILDQTGYYNIIIDGLLGTGIKGKIREPIATAIDFINEAKTHKNIPIISIDVPSGLNPDTGEVSDKAVKADLVITFHKTKIGMKEGREFINEIVVRSIGIPQEAELFVGRGDIIPTLKLRRKDAHKGQYGRLLVIGGSKNYSGAPAYSSLTGIGFGIDLVITYTPEVIGDVLRSYSPNLIVRSSPGDWLNLDCFDEVSWLVDWANTIVIGPGLGQEKETENLLVELLKLFRKEEKNFVLDADALKLVKNHLELLSDQSVILTPHEGELKIMTDIELPSFDNLDERIKIISDISQNLNVTLLIKGPYDYISDTRNIKINKTGCPEMAIGGTGDVLAGLCGCFLSIGNSTFNSACSAAFLNGINGEYCKKTIGPRFTAMDMIKNINPSIEKLLNEKEFFNS